MIERLKELDMYKVKTHLVVFDFSQNVTIEDYQLKIGKGLQNLDIAMLFLNAGQFSPGNFVDLPNNVVESTVAVNALHPIYTAKVLV